MKSSNFYYFSLISVYIILIIFKCCQNIQEEWYQPKDLKKINTIYKSSYKVSRDQTLITYYNVFFLDGYIPKGFDYNDLGIFSTAKVFNLYGNTFRKPLLYTYTNFAFNSIILTKDCNIFLYAEDGENTCENKNLKYTWSFENLGSCYDSLRIYYDTKTKDAAVYNYNRSNKIDVISIIKSYFHEENFVFAKVENKYNVLQSLIYSRDEKNSILIAIDSLGVRFFNLRGEYSWIDYFRNTRLIESYDYGNCVNCMADFIDDKNKLLYIHNNNFIVFDLKNLKVISTQNNFINGEKIQCLLGLKDENALVGTDKGNIYLLGYTNGEIKKLDNRKICDGIVFNLAYNNNCVEGKKSCYVFVANCGYLHVFEIGTEKQKSTQNYPSSPSSPSYSNYKTNIKFNMYLLLFYIIFIL